jgi:hypothetical protein
VNISIGDLIVTMDDATGEHYSMFFVEEEGTASNFAGVELSCNLFRNEISLCL